MKYALLILFSFNAHAGDPMCASSAITLHKGPSAQSPVSWKVGKFMPFLRLDHKGSWSKVSDMDGEIHWAPSNDLTRSFRCVAVKAQIATLRQMPLQAAPTAEFKTVDRYTPLKRLDSDGDWVQVEDEAGHKSWINSSNVWTPMKIQSIDF